MAKHVCRTQAQAPDHLVVSTLWCKMEQLLKGQTEEGEVFIRCAAQKTAPTAVTCTCAPGAVCAPPAVALHHAMLCICWQSPTLTLGVRNCAASGA